MLLRNLLFHQNDGVLAVSSQLFDVAGYGFCCSGQWLTNQHHSPSARHRRKSFQNITIVATMTPSDSGIAAGNVHYAETTSTSKKSSEKALTAREQIQREDEVRLSKCGYKQVDKKCSQKYLLE
jgi:hypothetical protein